MTAINPEGDLIALAERLSGLLTEESALLAAARTREIAALQADKTKVARAFEAQVAAFARTARLAEMEPGLRERLKRAMGKVRETLAQNARALRAARDANQKLIDAIVKAVAERNNKLNVYAETGGIRGSLYGARPVPKAVSLSVDQRL